MIYENGTRKQINWKDGRQIGIPIPKLNEMYRQMSDINFITVDDTTINSLFRNK
jgi:hypothetical protein